MIKMMPLINLRRTSNPSSLMINSRGPTNRRKVTTTKSQLIRTKRARQQASTNQREVALTMDRARQWPIVGLSPTHQITRKKLFLSEELVVMISRRKILGQRSELLRISLRRSARGESSIMELLYQMLQLENFSCKDGLWRMQPKKSRCQRNLLMTIFSN